MKLETLQESVLVPLDIFGKVMENKTIESKLEAWLVLISSDEPKRIIELLEKYPELGAFMRKSMKCAEMWRELWVYFQKNWQKWIGIP